MAVYAAHTIYLPGRSVKNHTHASFPLKRYQRLLNWQPASDDRRDGKTDHCGKRESRFAKTKRGKSRGLLSSLGQGTRAALNGSSGRDRYRERGTYALY